MTEPLVIYHASCFDGFTAAWIAWRMMPDCELMPAHYGDDPPGLEKVLDRDVYVLDFSYPREALMMLKSVTKSLTVLDHHKSAEEACKGLSYCTFNMNKSGARMAADYFMGQTMLLPWIIESVQDRDLWRFWLKDTKDINAYLQSIDMTMENWEEVAFRSRINVAEEGEPIRRYIEKTARDAARHARFGHDERGRRVIILNASWNVSDTAHFMLEQNPHAEYALCFFQVDNGNWVHSLRSRPDEVDVSIIAAASPGGGGHACAAGYKTDFLEEFLR